jgi:PAS domain S-box-containing protein
MLNRMASVPTLKPESVWHHIQFTLGTNPNDIPFSMLYEAEESAGSIVLRLRGYSGLPEGHPLIVDGEDVTSDKGLVPECHRAGREIRFVDHDERFAGVEWCGFGVSSKKIAVLPITSGERTFGYLISGTNPCRPDDEACEQFQKDLRRMVSSVISAAVNAEDSKKRQQQLEDDLAFSDMKLRHLIEHASVGMVHISLEGELLWANEHYFALSGRPAEQQAEKKGFFDVYVDEDQSKAEDVWNQLLSGANHITAELRLKKPYRSPSGETAPAHIQVLAFPYRENGQVKSIMACTTDISRLKWAQTFQARLAAEAREAKRQQEAFIDVVSHEMRNPLSAIVHCADEISSSLAECQTQLAALPKPCLDALNENVASANIIMQCAHHQKRIIDDVLTLSKLDSMLLSITPTATRPPKLISSIVAIFEAELKSHNIRISVVPDPSLPQLCVDYLYLDPSRVTQIFINLITNAIKFVKSSAQPSISIRFGASLSKPHDFFPKDMFWATKSKETCDMTGNPEWGTGEIVYLSFMVKDSGIGMREKEINKIFERFRQANMRTHVKYGGSGLGLFISKELTEKQGGEIGVSSVLGEGSTFGFYVKTRRVERRPQSLSELFHNSDGATSQELNVLLVEDNIINQQVLCKQLRKAGCIVEVANHGQEALNSLERRGFDVVLMDLEMPVMDGLTAMQEIRKRQKVNKLPEQLPIIAVTANVRQEQIDTALEAGAVSANSLAIGINPMSANLGLGSCHAKTIQGR